MRSIKQRSQPQSRKALITGVSGFVGSHLAAYLASQAWQVSGFDQRAASAARPLYLGNLMDRSALTAALHECQPNVIFHLAGSIKSAQPEALYRANLLSTVALFECVLELRKRPIVIVASSSAVYGSGFGGKPITEKFRPRPVTHYAVSKLIQETAALLYYDAFGLSVIILRMFNLLGPGQSPDLACSAFARQIAEAELCGHDEIVTGDLRARRDFVDVRDAVRAFALLAERGRAGQIYNACSERAVSIRKCLGQMVVMSPRPLKVRRDAERLQKNDVPVQVGNATKLRQATGWRPQISLSRSLSDLLDDWRQRVKSGLECE